MVDRVDYIHHFRGSRYSLEDLFQLPEIDTILADAEIARRRCQLVDITKTVENRSRNGCGRSTGRGPTSTPCRAVVVQAVLNLVNDVTRTRRLPERPGIDLELRLIGQCLRTAEV